MGLRPPPRLGIQRLAGAGNHAQSCQIVLLRILLAVPHEHPQRRGSGEHLGHAVALNNLPRCARMRVIHRALAEHGGHARAQGRIHDVRMPDYPSNV